MGEDHTPSLALHEEIVDVYLTCPHPAWEQPEPNVLAQHLIDGPLSHLSVLVQIPKVRELAELLRSYRHSRHAGTVVLNTHMVDMACNWIDALEAKS